MTGNGDYSAKSALCLQICEKSDVNCRQQGKSLVEPWRALLDSEWIAGNLETDPPPEFSG